MIKSQRHVPNPPGPCVDEDVHRERSFLHSVVPDLASDPCLVSSGTCRRRHYRSSFSQARVAWGVASGVPFQSTYVLVLSFVGGRSVAVALLCFLGLIDTWRGDPPGSGENLSLVSQREQSTWWAHVTGTVALASGGWVGSRGSPIWGYAVNEWAASR